MLIICTLDPPDVTMTRSRHLPTFLTASTDARCFLTNASGGIFYVQSGFAFERAFAGSCAR